MEEHAGDENVSGCDSMCFRRLFICHYNLMYQTLHALPLNAKLKYLSSPIFSSEPKSGQRGVQRRKIASHGNRLLSH